MLAVVTSNQGSEFSGLCSGCSFAHVHLTGPLQLFHSVQLFPYFHVLKQKLVSLQLAGVQMSAIPFVFVDYCLFIWVLSGQHLDNRFNYSKDCPLKPYIYVIAVLSDGVRHKSMEM